MNRAEDSKLYMYHIVSPNCNHSGIRRTIRIGTNKLPSKTQNSCRLNSLQPRSQ
ncbi:hypothetical protein CJ030_MR2G016391 [Morella rubra]|uniref:Uncharacterized protein n=1 Tax=Morella rubra TaxID=262757 RepID=A0A6A1WGT8_9ROSI|nr:hypothetical protein CJ030_MR2G016391 [Morella rubra]